MDLLKSGVASGADLHHFWDILDNTYIDDVSQPDLDYYGVKITNSREITMAMMAGRPSIYDNDVYLSATHPAALMDHNLTQSQKTTRAMMHILIQCPRLTVAIRYAIRDPTNVVAVATAISLAEKLWHLTQLSDFDNFINASIEHTDNEVDDAVADILLRGIRFSTTPAMVIGTRYWLLQVMLCGTVDTLFRRFPAEYALSLLPDPDTLYQTNTGAAMQLGRMVSGLGANPSPLILVRMHGPLSVCIGAWYRQIRYLTSRYSCFDQGNADKLFAAERMKKWISTRCNALLKLLHINPVDEDALIEAFDCTAGEEIADWIPSKVGYGLEDGEMVMKFEYSDRTANGDLRLHGGTGATRVINVRNPANFGPQHLRAWIQGNSGPCSG